MPMPHDPRRLPGPLLARRTLLALPAVAGLPSLSGAAPEDATLDFAAFARLCEDAAAEHLENGRALPEALILTLERAGSLLQAPSVPRPSLGAFGGYRPSVSFGPVHRAPPVMMIQWKLEPNAVLPPHNHTPVYVVSLCLEGECRVRHFEIDGDAPAPGAEGAFELRETRARLLRPGLCTSLTPERDNIHTFQAGPRGALGVDINVFLPGEGDWSMIAMEDGPRPEYERRYSARWIGKPS